MATPPSTADVNLLAQSAAEKKTAAAR
jgi:hypothetical protein